MKSLLDIFFLSSPSMNINHIKKKFCLKSCTMYWMAEMHMELLHEKGFMPFTNRHFAFANSYWVTI